jgi:hypothetical protein
MVLTWPGVGGRENGKDLDLSASMFGSGFFISAMIGDAE